MNYISCEFAKESSNFDFSSWLQQRVFRVNIWNISIPKGLMKGQHTLTLSCGVAITALFFSFLQRTIFWERQVPSSPLVSLWYHCAHYSYDKVALCKLFFSSHCGFIRNRKEFQFAFYFQKNRAGSLLRRPHLSMSSNNFFLSLFLVPLDQRVFSREGTNSFEISSTSPGVSLLHLGVSGWYPRAPQPEWAKLWSFDVSSSVSWLWSSNIIFKCPRRGFSLFITHASR